DPHRRPRRGHPRARRGGRRHRADPRLPAGDAGAGRQGARARRHPQGGLRGDARRAGPRLRALADLRALPALRRVPALGRALRHRAAGHLDRRTRPRGLGPAPGLTPRKARSDMPNPPHPPGMRTPVLVLGAGPVGQTAALLLARWGLEPIVLDGAPERDPVGSKAIVQQRDVLDVWHTGGAGAVAEEGLTWDTARTFYRDRELFATRLHDRGASPLPPFVNLSQARTEEILDARLAEEGIGVRWNHRLTGIEQDPGG